MTKDQSKDGWRSFLELCTKVKSPDKFERFFDLFLTIEEKENFASRFLIVRALIEGKLTQREMAEKYKVSIAQITRGSNAVKIIDAELLKFLKNHLK